MRQPPLLPARQRGFTLLEIVIAVVIVAVLTAIALPSYQSSVRKGRRAEAFAALSNIQQAQERFRGNSSSYGNLNSPADSGTLPNPVYTTSNGYYALSITGNSATGYTAVATGQSGQANDGNCKMLGVRLANGAVSYGSGASSLDWSDPGRCWAK